MQRNQTQAVCALRLRCIVVASLFLIWRSHVNLKRQIFPENSVKVGRSFFLSP